MCMGKHICLSKILFGVLLLCLVSSCRQESRNFDYYLELAEENLETAPDSTAYHLLHDSIDDSMLSSATQRQLITYWYLLARMSMTLSVKVPKDFYLSACARYFSENEPSPLAVKAFVLWSEQLRGSGDYSYAIVPALRAYKTALDLDNEGLRLMAERELAEVLGRAPGIRDAVPHIDCLVDLSEELVSWIVWPPCRNLFLMQDVTLYPHLSRLLPTVFPQRLLRLIRHLGDWGCMRSWVILTRQRFMVTRC